MKLNWSQELKFGLSFTITADEVSRLTLVIDQADDLMIDNQAYCGHVAAQHPFGLASDQWQRAA